MTNPKIKVAPKRKELTVPKFTEAEAESIKQGLLSPIDEIRANTFVTVFGKVLPVIPTFKIAIKDAEAWRNVNASTFEVIGGVSRHALWADENPGDFYRQMGHTFAATASLAVQANGPIIFQSSMPISDLDTEEVIEVNPKSDEDFDD